MLGQLSVQFQRLSQQQAKAAVEVVKVHGYSEEITNLHEELDMPPEVAAGGKASLIPKSVLIVDFSHHCNLYSRFQFLDTSLLVGKIMPNYASASVMLMRVCALELVFVCITGKGRHPG